MDRLDILNGHFDDGNYEKEKLNCPECEDGEILSYISHISGFESKEAYPCKKCGFELKEKN